MVNSRLVGCGQRIVWVAAQAIRATSLMSGVSCSQRPMGTPDNSTIAYKQCRHLSGDADWY
ncbi:hypothetical protein GCM10011408_02500 [Dyella caseinilytica]|nr:hypothetical protein GCM10011408_02500 [Dyella caseinilytica]